jgi:hypothetical protein
MCSPYVKYCKIDKHARSYGCPCCYPCAQHNKLDEIIDHFDGTVRDWHKFDWDSFNGKSVSITCVDGSVHHTGGTCYNADDYAQVWLIPNGAIIYKKDIVTIKETSSMCM